MLLPAIVAVHTIRKYLVERDLPHPPVGFLLVGVAVLGLLFGARGAALEGIPSHRLPTFDQARANLVRGFSGSFFLVPAKRPFQSTASWFTTLLLLSSLVSWRWLPRSSRFGLVAGLALGALFELPFIFIIKAEQLHLVTMAASLSLTAAAFGIVHVLRTRSALAALAASVIAAGLVAMSFVARDITRDFEPGGPIVRRADHIVQEWAAVPLELRDYLATKAASGPLAPVAANPSSVLPIVTFGLHSREMSPDGVPLRWMAGPRAEIYVSRNKRLVTIPLRHEIGAFREPTQVRIKADGRSVMALTLRDGDWHRVDLVVRPREASRLRGMHRVEVEIDHAWVPAEIIPGSTDTRTLGLQIGAISTR